jgi:hypothetical protein
MVITVDFRIAAPHGMTSAEQDERGHALMEQIIRYLARKLREAEWVDVESIDHDRRDEDRA